MILYKKFKMFFISVLLIAFSLGFSQSIVNAADSKPIGWTYINSTWYYLDASGNKVTNKWQQDRSMKWFYLTSTGAMAKNKWQQDSTKKWFYLGTDGSMVTNKWQQDSSKKWFYLGSDGAMVVNQWESDSTKRKFYCGSDGAMTVSSFVQDSSGKKYYCGADGAMALNTWVQDASGKKYYMSADGVMKTSSWVSYSDKWYYVNTDGTMAVNTTTPDGYKVDSNGVWDGKPSATADTKSPVITLKGSATVTISAGTKFIDPGVTVNDNVDTSIKALSSITDPSGRFLPSFDVAGEGTYKITYTAVDAAGNKAAPIVRTVIVTAAVPVVDKTPPVIALNGYASVTIKNGLIYVDAGAAVTDNVDTTISAVSEITDSTGTKLTKIDTTKAGTYKITFNAVDKAGNKAVPVVRTITVKPVGAPISFAIDIGHNSAYDGGATGIRQEDACTKEVGTLVMSKLKALGYDVINTAPTRTPVSTADSLQQRCDAANSAGADYYAAIHFNVGGGTGTETYYYQGNSVGQILATNVLDSMVSIGYTRRRVISNSTFYVLRNTDMPAILIECSFLDSTTDMNMYNADSIAEAIVKGLTAK